MSEQQFLDQLKSLKTDISKTTETVKELAKSEQEETKQTCYLNMWSDLNNYIENIELMIESIESKSVFEEII